MERLTTRHNGVAVIRDKSKHKEAMEKLARYEDIEDSLNNTVYSIEHTGKGADIIKKTAVSFQITKTMIWVYGKNDKFIGALNHSVFLTKAEAEKALEEMEK